MSPGLPTIHTTPKTGQWEGLGHSRDKMDQAFPLCFFTLQPIKSWMVGRPGNDTLSHTAYHHVVSFRSIPGPLYLQSTTIMHVVTLRSPLPTIYSSSHGKGVARANLGRRLYSCTTNVRAFKASMAGMHASHDSSQRGR